MKHILLSAAAFTLIFSACEKKPETENSAVRVTEVKHSKTVKQQTINNCWIYSAASWMESLSAITTEEELNVSESYWAYWHWYHQLAVKLVEDGAKLKKSSKNMVGSKNPSL